MLTFFLLRLLDSTINFHATKKRQYITPFKISIAYKKVSSLMIKGHSKWSNHYEALQSSVRKTNSNRKPFFYFSKLHFYDKLHLQRGLD